MSTLFRGVEIPHRGDERKRGFIRTRPAPANYILYYYKSRCTAGIYAHGLVGSDARCHLTFILLLWTLLAARTSKSRCTAGGMHIERLVGSDAR